MVAARFCKTAEKREQRFCCLTTGLFARFTGKCHKVVPLVRCIPIVQFGEQIKIRKTNILRGWISTELDIVGCFSRGINNWWSFLGHKDTSMRPSRRCCCKVLTDREIAIAENRGIEMLSKDPERHAIVSVETTLVLQQVNGWRTLCSASEKIRRQRDEPFLGTQPL